LVNGWGTPDFQQTGGLVELLIIAGLRESGCRNTVAWEERRSEKQEFPAL
jgi:hypothetical protein